MQVETQSMDPRIAAIYYRDYRHKVRAHREERRKKLEAEAKAAGRELGRIRIETTRMEKEDEELLAAYRALSRGQRILNINSVFRNCGLTEMHLPELALARADWTNCHIHSVNNEWVVFSSESYLGWRGLPSTKQIRLHRSLFDESVWNTRVRMDKKLRSLPYKAIVPTIPAHLRPTGDLSDYHILWEAKWEPIPPVDPILLQKIGETTYIVLAQWDLTPIEQAVLEGRLT
jgi:hypothetical protein